MRPAFLLFIIISAHFSVMVDCRPKLRHRDQMINFNIRTTIDLPAERLTLMKNRIHKGLFVILPIATSTTFFVSICMNLKGALFKSRQKDKLDCVHHHEWSDVANHHDVLHSKSGKWLLRVGAKHLQKIPQNPSDVSSDLQKKLLHPLIKRRRREDVNPSDPLRSESNPSRPPKDGRRGQPEHEQTGSVSKETIASVDDPLWVLRANGHGSPVKINIADRAEH